MILQVGPITLPVVFEDLTKEDLWGEFWPLPKPQIRVNSTLSKPIQALTILHELLECITEVYGLRLSEGDIRTLEIALGSLIKQNPQQTQEWLRMLSQDERM
tara:strand:- start:141 stop:446 length:306 start_codon:yes stop_codon:yes gene_type:complete